MPRYKSDGYLLMEEFDEGYDDIAFLFSPGQAYAEAYLRNGGLDEN